MTGKGILSNFVDPNTQLMQVHDTTPVDMQEQDLKEVEEVETND